MHQICGLRGLDLDHGSLKTLGTSAAKVGSMIFQSFVQYLLYFLEATTSKSRVSDAGRYHMRHSATLWPEVQLWLKEGSVN